MTNNPIQINRTSTTEEVTAWVKQEEIPALAYTVGSWVWLEFSAKPDVEIRERIKAAGFHWNNNRVVWQHPCGNFARHSKTDPRLNYAMEKI